jgi:phosphoribosylformylglycinamidine cyclo-ligase
VDYRDAGVDPSAKYGALGRMAERIRGTFGAGVIPNPGGYAGLYRLAGYRDPVLCSTTDGVGTKVKIAIELDRHDTVGIDLVAMSVNDLIVQGARPLFFLDYIAAGEHREERLAALLDGIVRGCAEAGCALLGGETASMPGVYHGADYDLAGFAVGVVERDRLITGERVRAGDVLLGLPSSGVHSNGYSLARASLAKAGLRLSDRPPALGGATVGEVLLTPTRIYVRQVMSLLEDDALAPSVRAIAHVTGEAMPGNLPRVLADGIGAEVHPARWPRPPIFDVIQRAGAIAEEEMRRVFNLGVGLVLVVDPARAAAVQAKLEALGEPAFDVGRAVPGEGVRFID